MPTLTSLLIPSMDLLGGRVVRLRHGDAHQATFYNITPEAWVARLAEAGAARIHLVDLDGAFGEAPQRTLRGFPARWPGVRFQLGGGLRSRDAVQAALDAGFEAVVGTLAVESPEALAGLPTEAIVLALDLRDGAVATRGWREQARRGTAEVCAGLRALGFGTALVTDVARDGTLEGPGLEAAALVAGAGFAVQVSGGLRNLEDLAAAARVPGVVGAISGKALLDRVMDLNDPAVRTALRGGR